MDENAIRALIAAEMAKGQAPGAQTPYAKPGTQGMGFGDIMHDEKANKAAQDAASVIDDGTALGLMELGNNSNLAARGGGVMSPFEAAANGLKQGIGTYALLGGIEKKKGAIGSLLRKKPDAKGIDGSLPTDSEGIPLSASGEYGFGD